MSNKNKPIIVAHIIGKWVGGGVEAVVMNYYRHIDKKKIQFDFICDDDSTNIPYKEIEDLGGRVILIPPYQKIFKYHKELKKILKEEGYKIVHSHINTLSVFSLFVAKCTGVPIRIAHSHSTTNKKEKKKNLMKQILKHFSKMFATNYFACTEHAARWLFGDKEYENGNVYLLNNAIDIEKFKFNENVRKQVRNELNIGDNILLIGHVGRFVDQKNHTFLIDVFSQVHKQNKNSVLLLVGQGPLQDEIKSKVNELGLENNVMFLGQRDDINRLYQAMDLFVFPSIYEGLGMVLIEAQCSGMACVASTEVPRVAKVNSNVYFLDLSSDIKMWTEKVNLAKEHKRITNIEKMKLSNYDIVSEAKKLERKYIDLLNLKDIVY